MTPADLRAEAEKVLDSLLRYDPISIPPADIDALVAFAQRHGALARLEGRIEAIDEAYHMVCTEDRETMGERLQRDKLKAERELAALRDKETG